VGESPLFICSFFVPMAFDVDQIRSTAQRVASSHGLDVVDIEFQGGAKHRLLRLFIEKNAEERHRLAQASTEAGPSGAGPSGVEALGSDQLAGITHEDCAVFSRDFGTVLDVEDLIPGGEYTLEVSSPGLDRRLRGREDYQRFSGMLVKIRTLDPVAGNRHWQGRLTGVSEQSIRLDLSALRQKTKSRRQETAPEIEIALANIEQANLIPEF